MYLQRIPFSKESLALSFSYGESLTKNLAVPKGNKIMKGYDQTSNQETSRKER
jgi:hypothetical protein